MQLIVHADSVLVSTSGAGITTPEADRKLNEDAKDHLRLFDEARRKMMALMAAALVAESPTGMNAHYRFASVDAGPYILHTATTLGSQRYEWWAPVSIRGGGSQQFDLDNPALENGVVNCKPVRD